jgi:hypothetical protein
MINERRAPGPCCRRQRHDHARMARVPASTMGWACASVTTWSSDRFPGGGSGASSTWASPQNPNGHRIADSSGPPSGWSGSVAGVGRCGSTARAGRDGRCQGSDPLDLLAAVREREDLRDPGERWAPIEGEVNVGAVGRLGRAAAIAAGWPPRGMPGWSPVRSRPTSGWAAGHGR